MQNKYTITNLISVVHNRTDRCGLERIIGLLFCQEYPILTKFNSLFGDILKKHRAFDYNYDQYINDISHKRIIHPFIKVWTGR